MKINPKVEKWATNLDCCFNEKKQVDDTAVKLQWQIINLGAKEQVLEKTVSQQDTSTVDIYHYLLMIHYRI